MPIQCTFYRRPTPCLQNLLINIHLFPTAHFLLLTAHYPPLTHQVKNLTYSEAFKKAEHYETLVSCLTQKTYYIQYIAFRSTESIPFDIPFSWFPYLIQRDRF